MWLTLITTVATLATAAFIGWQAVLTRRALAITEAVRS